MRTHKHWRMLAMAVTTFQITACFLLLLSRFNVLSQSLQSVASFRDEIDVGGQDAATNDIAFDLADIARTVEIDGGRYQLEAFKSTDNDAILRETDRPRASELIWFSVGHPRLVPARADNNLTEYKFFHDARYGFYVEFDMLTADQRRILAETASEKYGITVSPRQIVSLILSKFECSFKLHDKAYDKYLVKGSVANFRRTPLQMDFDVPSRSVERKLMMELLAENPGHLLKIRMTCIMLSRGKEVRTSTLRITSQKVDQLGLQESLFRPNTSSVYVTRKQMADLARDMYSKLNIIEEYEMPQSQFSEAFVHDLVLQTAASSFSFVPVDQALQSMSKYTFDDLRPDIIKRHLGSIFKLEHPNNTTQIVVDEAYLNTMTSSSSVSDSYSTSSRVGIMELFDFVTSMPKNVFVDQSDSSSTEAKSLDDQLRELNAASRNEILWEIEGGKVMPKNLNVARLLRGRFTQTLRFRRIRIEKVEAPFKREFAVYTHHVNSRVAVMSEQVQAQNAAVEGLNASINRLSIGIDDLSANVRELNVSFLHQTNSVMRVISTQAQVQNAAVERLNTSIQELSSNVRPDIDELSVNVLSVNASILRRINTVATNLSSQISAGFDELSDRQTAGIGELSADVRSLNASNLRHFNSITANLSTQLSAANCAPKLILQNLDGSDFFNRSWAEFKAGFGNTEGNYWAGLDYIHGLTETGSYKLRIEVKPLYERRWYYAEYTTFQVASESTNYTLTVGGFNGTVGYDAFGSHLHNGKGFKTYDRDNDRYAGYICASRYGAFWYDDCNSYFSPTAKSSVRSWAYTWYRLDGSNSNFIKLSKARMLLLRLH